jgi:hypothetical protein
MSTALNNTHFPSGETMGSLIRFSDLSQGVKN